MDPSTIVSPRHRAFYDRLCAMPTYRAKYEAMVGVNAFTNKIAFEVDPSYAELDALATSCFFAEPYDHDKWKAAESARLIALHKANELWLTKKHDEQEEIYKYLFTRSWRNWLS